MLLLDDEEGLGFSANFFFAFAKSFKLDVVIVPNDLALVDSLQTLFVDAPALVVEQAVGVSHPGHSS